MLKVNLMKRQVVLPDTLDQNEAAVRLGCSVEHVEKLARSGCIGGVYVGKRILFLAATVDKYISRRDRGLARPVEVTSEDPWDQIDIPDRDSHDRAKQILSDAIRFIGVDEIGGDAVGKVYFIRCGFDGPIKIGTADDPVARMQSLQIGNHRRLHLLAHIRGGHTVETGIHTALEAHWIRGEWFHPDPIVLAVVWAAAFEAMGWEGCRPANQRRRR